MSESPTVEKGPAEDSNANVGKLSIEILKGIVMAPDDVYDPAFQICAYQELQKRGVKIEV